MDPNGLGERPLLELMEGKEFEAKQDQIARSKLLSLTEAALEAVGIGKDTAPGRIMRLIVRVAGLEVFTKSRCEIASDPDVQCEVATVPGALRRLHDVGLIRRGCQIKCGRKSIVVQAVYSEIVSATSKPETAISDEVEWSAPRGAPRINHVARHVSDTYAPRGAHVARHVSKVDHTIYPIIPFPSPSPSEAFHADDEGDELLDLVDETNGSVDESNLPSSEPTRVVTEEAMIEAAVALRDSFASRTPKRAEEAREDLWKIVFVGLFLEGRSQIDRWIRAAKRKQPQDWPDYFFSCARTLCLDHSVRIHELHARCPPLPTKRQTIHAPIALAKVPDQIDEKTRFRIYQQLQTELGRAPTDEEMESRTKVLT